MSRQILGSKAEPLPRNDERIADVSDTLDGSKEAPKLQEPRRNVEDTSQKFHNTEKIQPEWDTTELLNGEVEAILSTAEVRRVRKLAGAKKKAFVELEGRGSAVYYEDLSDAKSARASYLVDKALGLNVAAVTVMREINGKMGCLEQFIPDAESGTGSYKMLQKDENMKDQLVILGLFDALILNTDRHGWNVVLKGDKVYGIDHDSAFSGVSWAQFDTFMWEDIVGRKIPARIRDSISSFDLDAEKKHALRHDLLEVLDEESVNLFFDRYEKVKEIVMTGSLPTEDPRKRSYEQFRAFQEKVLPPDTFI